MWNTGQLSNETRRRNPYARMNPVQLRSEIERTEEKLHLLRHTLEEYGDNPIELYECGECGNRFIDVEDCVQHLIDVHNYPDDGKCEDAYLATHSVWTRG